MHSLWTKHFHCWSPPACLHPLHRCQFARTFPFHPAPHGRCRYAPRALRLQVVSDLHIELQANPRKLPDIAKCTSTIALLGDIGDPHSATYALFLRHLSSCYETVLVLAGNHEYYGGVYEERLEKMKAVCQGLANVIFLNRTRVELAGFTVLGCTLWSYVPKVAEPEVQARVHSYARIKRLASRSEQRVIKSHRRALTVADTNQFHRRDLQWLAGELRMAKASGRKVVVLTHYAPLMEGTSSPRDEGSSLSNAFATDLCHLMGPPVLAWCFGHTHHCCDFDINGTRVVSNQKGYEFEPVPRWDPCFVLEVG